jgi:hypothetical protein
MILLIGVLSCVRSRQARLGRGEGALSPKKWAMEVNNRDWLGKLKEAKEASTVVREGL